MDRRCDGRGEEPDEVGSLGPHYEVGSLIDRVRHSLRADEKLHLDQIYLENGGVYDFVTLKYVGSEVEDQSLLKIAFQVSTTSGVYGVRHVIAVLVNSLTSQGA